MTPTGAVQNSKITQMLAPITLITGGSRGIGLALADRFALAGNDLLLVARDADSLAKTRQHLLARHVDRRILTLACDVTGQDATELIAAKVESEGFYVDILVNNVALWSYEPIVTLTATDIPRLIGANITQGITLVHRFLTGMVSRRHGYILNVGSLAGAFTAAGSALYSSSKAFLATLTLALQRETADTGVSVSLLLPGVVATDFTQAGVISNQGRSNILFKLVAIEPAAVAQAAYLGLMTKQGVIVPGLAAQALRVALMMVPASFAAWLYAAVSPWLFGVPTPKASINHTAPDVVSVPVGE